MSAIFWRRRTIFNLAVHDLIKDLAVKHQRIVFNGNGYSKTG